MLISACSRQSHTNSLPERGAKFAPPIGRILVFVGQDNESVGGNDRFNNGYVDHLGVPAGVTHYIGIGSLTKTGEIPGLNVESTWGAGPMCLKYYLDSPNFKGCVIHLSISMVDCEQKIAKGDHDLTIFEIAKFLKSYPDHPYFLRIGYEFDGEWNRYDSTAFKKAFRHIVDRLKAEGVTHFATVFASSSPIVDYSLWQAYYPGDGYVDWCGYSYWGESPTECPSIQFAKDHNKPIFIAEITPRGRYLSKENGQELWKNWFDILFQHLEDNYNIVKAISYINCDWDSQPMWDDWGDTRIQANAYIKQNWLEKLSSPRFINGDDEVFALIGFKE